MSSAKRDAALHLGLDLILAHEQVGVVLGEAAHAQQAVQHARALVAVDRAQLGQRSGRSRYERRLRAVDGHVERAVHRLDQVALALELHAAEQVLLVVGQVAGRLEQLLAGDVRRVDRLVAAAHGLAADRSSISWRTMRALGVPEHEARARPARRTRTDPARLPSTRWSRRLASSSRVEVLVQLLLRGERGAVDPLEHRVALVAAPVGAGERQHLEGLDVAGAVDVRAPAQIDEVAVLEERDLLVLGDRLDDLDLVGLAAGLEQVAAPRRALTTCRSNGRSSAMILAISASIARRPRARTARCRSRSRSRSRSTGRWPPWRPGAAAGPRRPSRARPSAACATADRRARPPCPVPSRARWLAGSLTRATQTGADEAGGGDAAGNGVREGKAVGTGGIEPPTPTVSR